MQHDLNNVSFNVEEDLFDLEEKYQGDIEKFWGDHDSEDVEGPTGNEGESKISINSSVPMNFISPLELDADFSTSARI